MNAHKRFKNFKKPCSLLLDRRPLKIRCYSSPITIALAMTLVFSASFLIPSPNFLFHPATSRLTLPIVKMTSSNASSPSSGSNMDWWSTYHQDMSHSGYSTSNVPLTNQTLWTFTTGGAVESSPAVVGGMVYVGSDDGYVYCLDAYTGALIWSYNTYGPVQSSPTVLDGVVYIGGFHSHAVFALNASTGGLIWNSPVASAGPHMISATAVANGLVYVGVYMYSSDFGGELYALNASTGAQVWDYQPAGWLPTSPVVSDGEVYVGDSTGIVTALDATSGDQLWSVDVCNYGVSNLCVVNGTVYVGTQTETVQALDALTGGTVWTGNVVGGVDSSCPAVADGIVYVSTSYGGNSISGVHPGGLCALNAATGASIWNVTIGSITQSSPAAADGVVFVGSDDTSIPLLPLINGHSVYAFNGTTGAIIWSYATGGSVVSSPAVANGVVYVGSDDDKVYAFGSPKQVAPPQISVLSPANQTYNQTSVPLTFTLDERVNWAGYSLDGRQDVTVTGNITLPDLASGSHSLVVYANDTIGNVGASQTINFTVALPTVMKPEPFSTLTLAAVSGPVAAVIVVVAGLLIYFNKRKHHA